MKDFGAGRSDPFVREMIRQAILISAREEFGLITRDPILGESLPEGAVSRELDYELLLNREKPIQVKLTGQDQSFGPFEIKAHAGKIDGYRPITWLGERFSREQVVTVLTELGYTHKPNKRAQPQPLPGAMQERLYDMDLITQFYLARELHALIRSDGENAQRLAALSHVYSNLGQLTRYRLDLSSNAMHARAFLYSRRAISLFEDQLEGHWAIVYAWMMFDLPGYGSDPLKRATRMADELGAEPPAWFELRKLYGDYNSIELMQRSRVPGPMAELAAILAAAASETGDVPAELRLMIENCRDVNPDTQRGYDLCFATNITWWLKDEDYAIERYERFHEAVPRLLREHRAQVPDAVWDVTLSDNPRPGEHFLDIAKIAWALQGSKNNGLALELSDAVIAHLIEEMLVAAAIDRYAQPSMKSLGQSTNPRLWEPIIEALQRNRYGKLFEIFRYSSTSPVQPREAICREVELGDMNVVLGNRLWIVVPESRAFANLQGSQAWDHLFYQFTQNLPGLFSMAGMYRDRNGHLIYSSWLFAAAPKAPFRMVTLIRDKQIDEQTLIKRVENANYMPGVLLAGAQWYEKKDMPDEAYNLYWQAIEMVPDKQIIAKTAEFAMRLGKQDTWLELMIDIRDENRDIPPFGSVELTITATLMEAGQWEEALFWAQAAFEERGWSNELFYLAWCLHKNGRTDEGVELMMRRDREIRSDNALRLVYILNLEDHLDAADANFVKHTLPSEQRSDPRRPFAHNSHKLVMKGEANDAIAALQTSWDRFKVTNDGVRLIILAEQVGDTALRDKMLNTMANSNDSDYRAAVTAKMASIILRTPDILPTDQEINGLINGKNRWSIDAYARLNMGWYLIAAGDTERGQTLLVGLLDNKSVPIRAYERYMAAIVLRQSGYDMDHHAWKFPRAHDGPAE